MEDDLALPDWNSGLWHEQAAIDCSPVKQPLAQVTLKDGNTQRVTALGRPGAAPGAAAAAAAKPAFMAAPPPALVHELEAPGAGHHAADGGVADAPAPPASASRRTHTPSRTGLKARAVRPSRLGLTPGAKQPEPFAVPAGTAIKAAAAAAAPLPPPTTGAAGGGLKSILKRLNFSGTKARGAPSVAPGNASTAAAAAAPRQPAGAAAQSTIKQLRFDAGATPAAGAATASRPAGGRHVTFDTATVSPGARPHPSGPGSAAPAAPGALPFTPEPTIREEDSASSDDAPGGGSVNSAAAGHTPFDRRLSSLFRKYQEAGTPELGDEELDALVEGGAVRSPSWKRLSSASVPESIRELAKKYDSDSASLRSLTPPDMPSPAAPAPGGEAATPAAAPAGGEGRSPTLDPTPHHVLDGLMQRNDLYESPPPTQPLGSAAPPSQPPPTQRLAGAASPSPAPAAGPAEPAAPPSPASAVASLLGPLLRATINDIEAEQAQQRQQAQQQPAPGSVTSPAEFYGFPPMDTPATAGATTPASAAPSSGDGVPRDADGVPTATPATVTVRRGSYRSSVGMLEEDDLAANLFSSFTPSDSGTSPAGGEVAEFGGFSAAPQETGAAGAPADTPAASSDFSFFPTAAAGAGAASSRQAATEGATPELAGASQAGVGISPEILGFYEQQEAAQRAAAPAAEPATAAAGPSASQAGGPMLPRSIIKSGRPLAGGGTPVLGHAQRGEAAPPPTITRELQALMADLRLEDPGELQQMGTVSALSPVRATGPLRGFLGGLARAITPVRRSARTRTPAKPLEAMLEETGYSYVPNAALMHDDAAPLVEAAEAKAARKAASQEEPSPAGGAGLPEAASAAPGTGRRYSTRGAARAESAAPEVQRAEDGAAAAASPPAADMALAGRRLSLRSLRTPLSRAHAAAEPATPAADVPVAQDASPHLAESPSSFAPPPSSAAAAAATPAPRSGYSLRSSTAKKGRSQLGPPKGTPRAQGSGNQEQQQRRGNSATPPQMSPTEQGIRASLRRSARKGRTAQ